MKRKWLALVSSSVILTGLLTPTAINLAQAATLPAATTNELSIVLANTQLRLRGLMVQIAADQAFVASVQIPLAAVRIELEAVAKAKMDTDAERALVATALANAQTTIKAISDRFDLIQKNRANALSVLQQLTVKFQELVLAISAHLGIK